MACPFFAFRTALFAPLLDVTHEDKTIDEIKRTPSMWSTHCTPDVLERAVETEDMDLIVNLTVPHKTSHFVLLFPGLLDLLVRKRVTQAILNLSNYECNSLDMCTPEILQISIEEDIKIAAYISGEEKNWVALYTFPGLVQKAMEIVETPTKLLVDHGGSIVCDIPERYLVYGMLENICPLLPPDFEDLDVAKLRELSYNRENHAPMCTPAVLAKAMKHKDMYLLENLSLSNTKTGAAMVAAPGVLDLALQNARLLYCLASHIECTPEIILTVFEMGEDGLPVLYKFSERYTTMICTLPKVFHYISQKRYGDNSYVRSVAKKTMLRITDNM